MTDLERKNAWLACPAMTEELRKELDGMDEASLHDSFYRNLTFGTGGLRGVLGAGTNRMNFFTVAKATRGGIPEGSLRAAFLRSQFRQPDPFRRFCPVDRSRAG